MPGSIKMVMRFLITCEPAALLSPKDYDFAELAPSRIGCPDEIHAIPQPAVEPHPSVSPRGVLPCEAPAQSIEDFERCAVAVAQLNANPAASPFTHHSRDQP